jgi:hypothetical protein
MRPQCTFILKDGLRCGLRTQRGDRRFCRNHTANASKVGTFQPKPTDPDAILEKLLRDSDPAIRLRALEMYEKREAAKSAAKRESFDARVLTADETAIALFAIAIMDSVRNAHGYKTPPRGPFALPPSARAPLLSMLEAIPETLSKA